MKTNDVNAPGNAGATLHAPEYSPVKENEQVLLSLGITADHIAALPMIVNTGTVFLLLEVRNHEVLKSLQPVPDNMRLLSDQYSLSGYCIFCRNTGKQADATARTFTAFSNEPTAVSGVPAAGALACYLYDIAMIKKDEMVILHGYLPGSPALTRIAVHLHLHDGKISSLQPGIMEPVQ
jgi:predicted PhzF superfamily epimerase YddE/YHI9